MLFRPFLFALLFETISRRCMNIDNIASSLQAWPLQLKESPGERVCGFHFHHTMHIAIIFELAALKLFVRSFRTLWATCIVAGEDPERLVQENRGFRYKEFSDTVC